MVAYNNTSLRAALRERLDDKDLLTILGILQLGIVSTKLREIRIFKSRSRIIDQNDRRIFCTKYTGLQGLFSKGANHNATTIFGRIICDTVKHELGNQGFFTTDEIPAYGISETEKRFILDENAANNIDLVAIFVYSRPEAESAKNLLDKILNQSHIEIDNLLHT